ncbi:MAG: chemotaxis protein CheA [Anaeromicrobium sp.]|jgi:two-component system chemotaxis sensor kinase CheA|uniref:chemotaxis protein CheA n=1 Tax=Anaeromicrobium sp. TaxID=1929132 RepID=UPI0025F3A1DF|nr:chemotaxis protein CheA [Anaeromicrobium sp.]MCT4595603.1 chemotaxis protein CheA [Anaeromicrobium sp.]
MDINQYLEIFIEESKENLQNMNEALLKLENDKDEIELVHEIFRVAHTLKGMSATMGFSKIAHFTHEMEDILQSVRSGDVRVTDNIIDVLFQCLDVLEEYINNIVETGSEGDKDYSHLLVKLHEAINPENSQVKEEVKEEVAATVENIMEPVDEDQSSKNGKIEIEIDEFTKNVLLKSVKDGFNSFKLKIELNQNCMLKSARAFIIFNTLEKDGEIVKANPTVEDIEDENFEYIFELVIVSKSNGNEILERIKSISEIENVYIETIMEKAGEPEKEKVKVEKKKVEPRKTVKKEGKAKSSKPKLGKTVRVDIDRLDNLMNLVSELIITRSRLTDMEETTKKQDMNESIEYLERITTNLHDAVMKVRMVPIERVFNRFPRMVRDLSKELGKEISLIMLGEETEVDRTVIDEIGDPLIHLIRNSIDHGIENPDERVKNGKSEIGTVKLIAYPDGNSVVIEVEDDGGGININKVKNKAKDNGLITEEQMSTIDDKDALQLLFKSGFSTADKISDISGRGVGLDVVKTKIESLGGAVEVQSTRLKGSKFVIRLPLTLAIIQALLVNVGEEKYAIALNSIKEIITIKSQNIRKIQEQEVVLYRDTTLPLLRMEKILDVNTSEENKEDLIVVVVKKGEQVAGFIVDGLIGQQEIVIKSLGKFLSGINIIAGATILGNGQVALIVDTNSLL